MKSFLRNLGIVLGAAAVGAGAALLFAPQSGERTRRQIRRKAETYAKDLCEDVNANAHELYNRGADNARRLFRRVRKVSPIAA
jgi:gas vesicle protein